jgi:hypothetical protein
MSKRRKGRDFRSVQKWKETSNATRSQEKVPDENGFTTNVLEEKAMMQIMMYRGKSVGMKGLKKSHKKKSIAISIFDEKLSSQPPKNHVKLRKNILIKDRKSMRSNDKIVHTRIFILA